IYIPKEAEVLRQEKGFGWSLTDTEEDIAMIFAQRYPPGTKPPTYSENTLKGLYAAQQEASKMTIPQKKDTPPLLTAKYTEALRGMRAIIEHFVPKPTVSE
ncbi:MAG: hypothetical protein QXM12_07275, partial [Nitrososphaerota archaeon]